VNDIAAWQFFQTRALLVSTSALDPASQHPNIALSDIDAEIRHFVCRAGDIWPGSREGDALFARSAAFWHLAFCHVNGCYGSKAVIRIFGRGRLMRTSVMGGEADIRFGVTLSSANLISVSKTAELLVQLQSDTR